MDRESIARIDVALKQGVRVSGKWPDLRVADADGNLMRNIESIQISMRGGDPPTVDVRFVLHRSQVDLVIQRIREQALIAQISVGI